VEQVALAAAHCVRAVEEALPRPRVLPQQQPSATVEKRDRLKIGGRYNEPRSVLAAVLKREDVRTTTIWSTCSGCCGIASR
jgi:hypothetical protein